MKLTGHTILITGGTSGIGLGFAKRFLELGNQVIICGRRKARLDEIQSKHEGIKAIICDVTNAAQRDRLFEKVIRQFPQTDILLNNAGIQLRTDLTKPVDLGNVRTELETNLIAPLHLSSIFAPYLIKQKEPAIINISSGLAFVPIAWMPVYCASKAAVHSLSLSLRKQLQNTAVRVFEIAPPSVDTELGHQHRADPTQSHGGMPVSEFIDESMRAIASDTLEAPVGLARNLWQQRESQFESMNP